MSIKQIAAALDRGGLWRTVAGSKRVAEVRKQIEKQGLFLHFVGTIKTRGGRRDVWSAETYEQPID